jgi:outer membrane protein assembly factor BamA
MQPGKCFIFLIVLAFALSPAGVVEAKKSNAPLIRFIIIHPKNVFDPNVPGEDRWPYTWANFLHITTRDSVVRRALLVKPGEPADKDLLDESERLLRTLSFIKDARIRTYPVGDGRVDVVVETHDTWTTEPQINFGSEGNESHFSAGILEENVLGYGKNASYFYRENPDGTSREYAYGDPQLFGSRVQLNTLIDDTPTGNQHHVNLTQPFYSLTTNWAAGLDWSHVRGLQQVVENGADTTAYDRDHNEVDTFVGVRLNRNPSSVHRLSLHYTYFSDYFRSNANTLPGTLPINKSITGPQAQWNWVESRFIKETFVDKAERVEDINLGHQLQLEGGYASKVLGSNHNTVPFSFSDQFGFGKEGERFVLTSFGVVGRYATYEADQTGGRVNNTLYFLNGNYYNHLPTEFPFTFVVHGETAYAQNIDQENQLQLGGDTGLRGFEVRSFTGNKSSLVNVEGRAFYPHELLHIAYMGGAAFIDAGEVQPQGLPYSFKDVHANVGVGFRVALTRSTSGQVYRFDVAYAIGPIQQDKRIIFSIAAGQGFHRAANTYNGFPGLPITQD